VDQKKNTGKSRTSSRRADYLNSHRDVDPTCNKERTIRFAERKQKNLRGERQTPDDGGSWGFWVLGDAPKTGRAHARDGSNPTSRTKKKDN